MKNILDLNHNRAKDFFLKEESYFSFDLPKYFKFSQLLQKLSKKLSGSNLSDFYRTYKENSNTKTQKPEDFEGVNYRLLNNKDGEYSWRLFQLIHPALYVSLVHKITGKANWKIILDKFKEFKKDNVVECASLPVVKSDKQKSNKAQQILTWWENIEQKSIILALEYDYVFHTDIVDCYGAIYTHSISWALHTKDEAKKPENRNNCNLIGATIDKSLRNMTNGQTNGIPQGSVLMDFIAEMVLGYADQVLSMKIKSISKDDYKIIRYRDDYRIFVNNPEIGRGIIKELSGVLSDLGMRLSHEKTKHSNDVIDSSIKSDKLFWIEKSAKNYNLEKQLLILHSLSKKYPNSGTLMRELQKFFSKIEKRKTITQNIDVLISILLSITFKNPRTYPISSAILSKLLFFIKKEKSQKEMIRKIKTKFKKLPNTEHLDLWLQRITLKMDENIEYQGSLSKKISDDSIEIWNSDWLKDDFKQIISSVEIIDKEEIKNMHALISNEEVAVFEQKNNYY